MDVKQYLMDETDLSFPQLSLITHMVDLLPFASSITEHTVSIVVKKTDYTFSHIQKMHGQYEVHSATTAIWDLLFTEEPMVATEVETDGAVTIQAYPLVDNGGKCIGAVSFVASEGQLYQEQTKQQKVLTDTVYRAMLVATPQSLAGYTPISFQDGVIIFDENGTILYGNESAIRLVNLLGFDRRLVGSSIFGSNLKVSLVQQVIADKQWAVSEEIYQDVVIRQRFLPISFGRGESRIFLFLTDITESSKQQQQLLVQHSVIKEIHHRVKNNLQTVASLLRMEGRRSDDVAVKNALQESISRIESMALVHDIVSHYEEEYISIRHIFDELCRLLKFGMAQKGQCITCIYEGSDIVISSHRGSYVSLLLNEMISNSIEHGLQGRDGTITLHVSTDDTHLYLRVLDDGIGLPADFSLHTSQRLGLQIINNLVTHELQGSLTMMNRNDGETGVEVYIICNRGE